jgi:hypothetical protein
LISHKTQNGGIGILRLCNNSKILHLNVVCLLHI